MFDRRVVLAALVGGLLYSALAYVMFDVAFAGLFAQSAGSATGVPREHQIVWAVILGNVSLAFLVALSINWARAASFSQGATIGAVFGFFFWLGTDSLQYGLTNLWKPAILIIDPVLSAIPYGVIGGVIALIMANRTELARLRSSA